MILQALYELAQREKLIDDPDFELKPVRWVIVLGEGGKFLGASLQETIPAPEGKKKPKPVVKSFVVARDPGMNSRTTNDYPGPLFDKREYMFGIAEENYKGETKPERAKRRQVLFRDHLASIHAATGDEAVGAAVAYLSKVLDGSQPSPDFLKESGPGDMIAFRYFPDGDLLVHQRESVKQWWRAQRQQEGGEAKYRCLVSGKAFGEIGLFPKTKRVPGVQGDISLISFNKPAFDSYGLAGNENAPVSREAAEAVGTGLNRLLNPAYPDPANPMSPMPCRTWRLSSDTGLCYWTRAKCSTVVDDILGLFGADPAEVRELYRSVWRGVSSPTEADMEPFYALVITGTQGRAILRDWFETTLGKAKKAIAQHFNDLRIVRNAPWKKDENAPPAIPLGTLLQSIASQGDSDNIPASLAAQFMRAALTGTLYPYALLTMALERARAEAGKGEWLDLQRRDARAALIKAVLNRRHRLQPSPQSQEVREHMDPNNTNPGYVLGCLMAVLERLQQEALGDVNASVIDKYFSGASAAPRATFDRLLKNARHHVKKAREGDNPGLVFRLERLIDQLMTRINVDHKVAAKTFRPIGFPLTLPIEQQGLFVIGYHHMRHFLWMNAETRTAWEAAHPDAPDAFVYSSKKTAAA